MHLRPLTLAVLLAALAVPAAAGAAPDISGTEGEMWGASEAPPVYTITAGEGPQVRWRLDDGRWARGRSPLVVTLGAIADGPHVLSARDARGDDDDDDDDDVVTRRSFVLDRSPPGIEVRVPTARAVYTVGQPVVARYLCAGALTCVGTVADGARLPTDRPGPGAFAVRATDAAGNASVVTVDYLVAPAPLIPSPAAAVPAGPSPRAGLPGVARLLRHARRLSPRAGSRVTSLRPLLSWSPHARARLYNLQLFAVERTAVRKVLSAFPAGPRLRVPRRTLAPGSRYVWRVWPYLAGGYPRAPLGVSTFDVARPARR
jgi:hypothetical protein